MGTTEHGFRYPEGSDLVISGDDAIQSLAEDVETYADGVDALLATHYANGFVFGASGSVPLGVPTVLGYGSGVSAAGAFAYNGSDTFTYSGPTRTFIIGGGVTASNGDPSFFAILELLINGGINQRSEQYGFGGVSLSYCFPCRLSSGDTIAQRLTIGGGGDAVDPYLRIAAV